jgi:ABC-type antimicrobial peptide transport system permease subunit
VALLLSALGVYGVVSCWVAARRREIGVRIAMGARGGQVLAGVLRSGLAPIAAGLGAGLGAALLGSDILAAYLHGVGSRDPLVFGVVPILLAATGILAMLAPARRAAATDPMTTLRRE